RQVRQQLRDLAERQAVTHPQDRRRRQGLDSQLPMRDAGRWRLLGSPALHTHAAMGAAAALRVIARGLDRAADQVLDNPLVPPKLLQPASAPWTDRLGLAVGGQRDFLMLVDFSRHGTKRRLVPRLAPWLPAPPAPGQAGLDERRQGLLLWIPGRAGRHRL